MPSVALQLSRLRRPWWKRPTTIGAAAIALCASPLLLAGWFAVAPQRGLPEGDEPAPASMTAMRDFRRAPLDADAIASIVRGNVLSSNRSEFSRPEETVVVQAPQQDRGAAEAAKRLEDARRDLATLRLVAVLRVGGEWIALFEPERRQAHEDLVSLKIGDVWQKWSVASITRDTVRVGFEGHTETLILRPRAPGPARAAGQTPPRGRIQAESRPVTNDPVRPEPPLSRGEARQRLLESTRGESERVRALAEELLRSLEREPQNGNKDE